MGRDTQAPLVLALENVTKKREQGGVAFELLVPSFIAPRGAFVAVVGPSGCGKSTLLDMLALVSRPTTMDGFTLALDAGRMAGGDATGDGAKGEGANGGAKDGDVEDGGANGAAADVAAMWARGDEGALARLRRAQLGYVLQTGGLLPFLTVGANIELPWRLNGRRPDRERILDMARRLGVEPQLPKKPAQLSGGQRQRAAVLRAISHGPELILADEPTAAVDKPRAVGIVRDFSALAREHGATIIMVTHDVDLVADVADFTMTFHVEAQSEAFTRSTCHRA